MSRVVPVEGDPLSAITRDEPAAALDSESAFTVNGSATFAVAAGGEMPLDTAERQARKRRLVEKYESEVFRLETLLRSARSRLSHLTGRPFQ